MNEKKVSFHNRRMRGYEVTGATLLGFTGLGQWNKSSKNGSKCEGKDSDTCGEADNVNSEMKSTVRQKYLEYGQKYLAEREMKKEAEKAVAVARVQLQNWINGAGERNNAEFCQNNPHLASCQGASANTFADTRFNPTSGSGTLRGRSLPNLTPDASDGDFGDGITDIADTFQDSESGNETGDFSGVGAAKFAQGGSTGGASAGGVGGSGAATGSGGAAEAKKEEQGKKKGIKASSLANLYKKKKKRRRRGRGIASKKDAKNFLANLLKKKGNNSKKGGIVFKNRKELNRALAHDGVRNRKGLNLFTRISRAHQSTLLNPKKELIVYNSP